MPDTLPTVTSSTITGEFCGSAATSGNSTVILYEPLPWPAVPGMLIEFSPPNWQPANSTAPRGRGPACCAASSACPLRPAAALRAAALRAGAAAAAAPRGPQRRIRGRRLPRRSIRCRRRQRSASPGPRPAGSVGGVTPGAGCHCRYGTGVCALASVSRGVVDDLALVRGDAVDRVEQNRRVVHRDALEHRAHALAADLRALVVVRVTHRRRMCRRR